MNHTDSFVSFLLEALRVKLILECKSHPEETSGLKRSAKSLEAHIKSASAKKSVKKSGGRPISYAK